MLFNICNKNGLIYYLVWSLVYVWSLFVDLWKLNSSNFNYCDWHSLLLNVGGKITLNFGHLFKGPSTFKDRVVSFRNLNTYLFTSNGQLELFLGGVGLKGVVVFPLFLSLSKGGWEECWEVGEDFFMLSKGFFLGWHGEIGGLVVFKGERDGSRP